MNPSVAASRAPARAMSLAEWAALPEDEPGELVDGELSEEEVPDAIHEDVVSWLNALLRFWLTPRGGFVLGSDAKFAVQRHRGRKPDLSVFLPGGHVPPRRGVIRVPPDMVVEVVSLSPRDVRRDRIEKVDDYAAFGVRFYWIIDPEARTFEIFELGAGGRYTRCLGRSEGAVDEVPGCPGLRIDLDELWAELDRLGPPEGEDLEE